MFIRKELRDWASHMRKHRKVIATHIEKVESVLITVENTKQG